MLKFLWLRLAPSRASETRALARYFRDEGLHAELEALCAHSHYERSAYAARAHFSA
jgi:hypothetical protein